MKYEEQHHRQQFKGAEVLARIYRRTLKDFFEDKHNNPLLVIQAFQAVQTKFFMLDERNKQAFLKRHRDLYMKIIHALHDEEEE